MKDLKTIRCFLILLLAFCSCGDKSRGSIESMVKEWIGKEMLFPLSDSLIVYGIKDTVDLLQIKTDYRIVSYIDSKGCISCKLQLPHWKRFITEVDSVSLGRGVPFLFYFHPQNKPELYKLLERYNFTYPVYIDEKDSLNKLNHLPLNMMFQTFLLDGNNKILAIGNPVLNPNIKRMYLRIIQGKNNELYNEKEVIETYVHIGRTTISLGRFNWQEEQKAQFMIHNVGKQPLVINDVTTSCGCTSVDYPKQPVRPGDSISLQVAYKADHPEHFDKTITVYCNTNPSLIQLKITGDAE